MTLFLLDAHALAYRSHFAFAKNPLVDSRGRVTSAVFGFARTLVMLLRDYTPDYLSVVFDPPDKTFRHRLYPEYKATREKMPDELRDQIPLIRELLSAFEISHVTIDGYEADDVVATLATRAEAAGMEVRILSGDKDFFQLLSPRTRLLRPVRGSGALVDFGLEEFEDRFGFHPRFMTDFLGLMGDSSDNVPGVPGVGEKTAKALVQEYGAIESILSHLEEIERKGLREKLSANADLARLSKRLVTMVRDVPMDGRPTDFPLGDADPVEVARIFQELDFHSLLSGFDMESAPAAKSDEQVSYRCVDEVETLVGLAKKLAETPEWSVDVETTSLDALSTQLVGLSFAVGPGDAYFVPVQTKSEHAGTLFESGDAHQGRGLPLTDVRKVLGPVLADPEVAKIGQNIKFDWLALGNHGLPLEGVAFDTMLASYCLDPGQRSHGLDELSLRHFGHRMIAFTDLFESKTGPKDIRGVPLDRLCTYACEDADYTLRLKQELEPILQVDQVDTLFREIEMPLMRVLKEMEEDGVAVDVDFLNSMSERLDVEIAKLTESIHGLAGEEFNLQSTPQLRRILFEKLKLPAKRRTKTGYSTGADVLSGLAQLHELPKRLLEYRELQKLKSTYVDALPRLVNPRSGRLHTSFNQAVAATGRLSSSDPNLQNIPIRSPLGKEIRKAFVPRQGNAALLDADYSQVELRILAHLTRDPDLVAAFREGADIHRRTAAKILGIEESDVSAEMRNRAKAVNFGVIYGMGARGLAANLGIGLEEAQGFIDDYFVSYPGVRDLIDETIERAQKEKVVFTLVGRRRFLPDIDSENPRLRSFSERIAVNTVVQGTAADMIKVAMIRIQDRMRSEGLDSRMILQVHDELVFDVRGGEETALETVVREEMSKSLELSVPVVVDTAFGSNWFEAH